MKSIIPAKLNKEKDKLLILDQTKLPLEEVFLTLDNKESIFDAIKKLKVRGAPAIGIAAALGIYVCMLQSKAENYNQFLVEFKELKQYFSNSRPTAVNLFWALDRMEKVVDFNQAKSIADIKKLLLAEAEKILSEDQAMSELIGKHALSLLNKNMGILTHCNAGGLATSGYGTALAPIYKGEEEAYNFKVYADETRPLLQGSRLTAYELWKAGVDVTVVCDNMAGQLMKEGKIDAVLVGADRIAANGDTANKIGTASVAILAKYYNIPFYVLAPTSTVDFSTPTGKEIVIEQRDGEEIANGFGRRTAPEMVKTYNPAFDVTEAELITAIITEKAVIRPPFSVSLLTQKD